MLSLKKHLEEQGLAAGRVNRIVVDADPSFVNSRVRRQLEPMARVVINGARPDLLALTEGVGSPLVVGFEVKAHPSDWVKGLTQSRRYRAGVHQSYLAFPAPERGVLGDLMGMAQESGVGVFMRTGKVWCEELPASPPQPLPQSLESALGALRGVAAARRLQLNHPLNYLVVPYLLQTHPGAAPLEVLRDYWPDLGSDGTRRHAVEGAASLGLIDGEGHATALGLTAADLLDAVGFSPDTSPPKRKRLSEASLGIAAIARSVLLPQPAVRLILKALERGPRRGETLPGLFARARRIDETLAGALFLADPSASDRETLRGEDINPSTVFKLKQVLWHAGLLSTKAHASAGKGAVAYDPGSDVWGAEIDALRRNA